MLREGERLEDLHVEDFSGRRLYIIQNPAYFLFGTDAVWLSQFARVRKGDRVLDLCCGGGIVPLLLHAKGVAAELHGVEIIPEVAEMARRSCEYNAAAIDIICQDLKTYNKGEYYHHITCNPPYMQSGSGFTNPTLPLTIARHEVAATLEDCVACAARNLAYGGKFSMVHRVSRLADVICTLRAYSLEPKRIEIKQSGENEPSIFLVEAVKGAGKELRLTITNV